MIEKGDYVKVIDGKFKGESGKVIAETTLTVSVEIMPNLKTTIDRRFVKLV